MVRLFGLMLFGLLCLSGFGQEYQAGQVVVVIAHANLETLDGSDASVFPGLPLSIMEIERTAADAAQPPRLLVSNGRPGWLTPDRVLLPEQALQFFADKLKANADDSETSFAYGMALGALKRHDEAIAWYSQLLEKNPNDTSSLNERAGSFIATGRYAEAVRDFDRLIEQSPQAVFYLNRSLCQSGLENADAARADLQKAIELDPGLYSAHIQLGRLEVSTGRFAEAVAVYDEVVRRFPQMIQGYLARANLHLRMGNAERGLADLDSAIALQPTNPSLQSDRAILLRNLGRTDESLQAFARFIEQFPDSFVGYINRGTMLEEMGRNEEALADLNRAVDLAPDSAFARFHRGCVQIELGNHDEAIEDFTRAIEIEPKAIAYTRRGEAHANAGREEAAIKDFNRALELDPDQHYARSRRGVCYMTLGDNDRALADFSSLIDRGLVTYGDLYHRARIRAKRQEFPEAIADYERAIAMQPEDIDGLNSLAWLLATLPDPNLVNANRAIELAQRACELTEWKQGLIIDTLAAAHAAQGDFAKAIELQELALQKPDATDREDLKEHLERYRAGQRVIQ